MTVDPDNKYLKALASYCPLAGSDILEIGCGRGRMTQDLALTADKVVATDLDPVKLKLAEDGLKLKNVEFVHAPQGKIDSSWGRFDLVIYSLSLHHIPQQKMQDHLLEAGKQLKAGGQIIIIEPGNSGSFMDVKKRFGAGSGDEGPLLAAAIEAMNNLPGWITSVTHVFTVDFLFTDKSDFYRHKLPGYQTLTQIEQTELNRFLNEHTTPRGIILSSERHLNIIKPRQ